MYTCTCVYQILHVIYLTIFLVSWAFFVTVDAVIRVIITVIDLTHCGICMSSSKRGREGGGREGGGREGG